MKKSDGPLVEIVGLTPELEKLASQELPKIPEMKQTPKTLRDQAKNYDKMGWGVVEPEAPQEKEKKIIKQKVVPGFELLISEKDQEKIEARRIKEQAQEEARAEELE